MSKKAVLLTLTFLLSFILFTTNTSAEEYTGIGISFRGYTVSFEDDKGNKSEPKTYYYVDNVLPGGPAGRAGIQVNDILLEVNGKSLASVEGDEVVNNIRGPEGSYVTVKIMRTKVDKNGYSKPPIEKVFTIQRQKVSTNIKKEEK